MVTDCFISPRTNVIYFQFISINSFLFNIQSWSIACMIILTLVDCSVCTIGVIFRMKIFWYSYKYNVNYLIKSHINLQAEAPLLDIRGTLNHLVKVETRHLTGSDDTRWTAVTPAISEKIDHEVGNLMIKSQILNSTIILYSVKRKNHYSVIQHLVGLIAPLWICTNIYLMIEQHLSYLEPFLSQK